MSLSQTVASWPRAIVTNAAVHYSVRNRRRKADRFSTIIADLNARTVLLVGAESAEFSWSNIVEKAVIDSGAWVVATGLGPDLEFPVSRVFCNGMQLPFGDQTFDLVISNAVVEHVGDAGDQATFVAEHHRVGRSFIVTTPNRWCPVESHTRTVLRHWSSTWRASRDEFTRLVSRSEFQRLLPPGTQISGNVLSPTFTAFYERAR